MSQQQQKSKVFRDSLICFVLNTILKRKLKPLAVDFVFVFAGVAGGKNIILLILKINKTSRCKKILPIILRAVDIPSYCCISRYKVEKKYCLCQIIFSFL